MKEIPKTATGADLKCPACQHPFTIEMIGLYPTTIIECPECEFAFRINIATMRELKKGWERSSGLAAQYLGQEAVDKARRDMKVAKAAERATIL